MTQAELSKALFQLFIDELRARLVAVLEAVEAERDAQSALADQAVKALAEMNNASGKLMMNLAAVMNERDAAQAEAARIDTQLQASLLRHRKDNRELGSLLETERCKVTELTSERETARAGEARAVEALRTIRGEDIYPDADGMIEDATCSYCYGNSIDGCDEDCPRFIAANVIDSAQAALDWLAQQRREAALRAGEVGHE